MNVVIAFSSGATELAGRGHWLNRSGQVVIEPIRIVESYFLRSIGGRSANRLAGEFAALAARMNQEALAVAVGHRLFLIRPSAQLVRTAAQGLRVRQLGLAAAAAGMAAKGGALRTG